jgi:hypothetical protein
MRAPHDFLRDNGMGNVMRLQELGELRLDGFIFANVATGGIPLLNCGGLFPLRGVDRSDEFSGLLVSRTVQRNGAERISFFGGTHPAST